MIGLVLQGGGAKGGYHVGVWKALRELGVEIGAVTGTSVGALIGSLVAMDKFDTAYELWYNMAPGLVTSNDPKAFRELISGKISIKDRNQYYEFIKKIIEQKGLDIEPLKNIIYSNLDEELLRKSKISFGLVTVSVSDLKAMELFVEDIEEGKVADYLLASCYLPGFKPQMIDGKRFMDGGFHDNLPINLVSSKGYKEIVAVQLNSAGIVKPIKDKQLSIRIIKPSEDTGSMLDFDTQRSRRNITMGYLDTLKSYGRYDGTHYYIDKMPGEDFFNGILESLTPQQIQAISQVAGYKIGYPKRVLYEVIIPDIASMMGLDLNSSYRDIMVSLLEYLASSIGVERLAPYDFMELMQLVKNSDIKDSHIPFDWEMLPDVLKRSNVIRKSYRDQLFMKWFEIAYDYVN